VAISTEQQPRRPGGHRKRAGLRRNGRRGQGLCAALDLGTNNCRLLVAKPADGGFRIVDAFSRVVRLGEGLDETGNLSEPAINRTIDALRVCATKIRRRGVVSGRYVATAACRNAENCDEFISRVEDETGLYIETISAEEEARLTVAGCFPLLDDDKTPHSLVFDIGGGSTEVMWLARKGENQEMVDWMSMPFGVVSLTERFGQGPFEPTAWEVIVGELLEQLAPFCEAYEISGHVGNAGVQMLGSSGTVTTLAGLTMELERYDRSRVDGSFLEFGDVHALVAGLSAMTAEDRAAHPCIGNERADMMAAGCAILEAICRRWPVGRLRVADRGVREGILVDLMGRNATSGATRNGDR
jgi:exopolyphosphatase/guanosine-5'-triphosphate,3'-diphosphate pyrophosphatase